MAKITFDELKTRYLALKKENDWKDPVKELPCGCGLSEPVWGAVQEFGCEPQFVVCNCFIPLGQEPKWYLDSDFYHLDCPMQTGPVVAWRHLPKLPKTPR